MSDQLQIPDWLDGYFLAKVLKESEEKNIKVTQMQVHAAIAPGENYGSFLYRLVAEYEVENTNNLDLCRKSFIVKTVTHEESIKKITTENNIFGIEAEVLWKIVPSMQRLFNMSTPGTPVVLFGPRCYHFSDQPPQNIVMEDLCALGLKMAQRIPGLDLEHSRLVLSRLGMFHAASVALKYKESNVFNNYLAHTSTMIAEVINNMFKQSLSAAADVAQTRPETGQRYFEKLNLLSVNAIHKMQKCVLRDEHGFNVFNHGDCWTNNMMFKYNEDGQVIDITFLDFQCCYYGSPALDLLYFLYTSPTPDVRSRYMDNLVKCYHSSLSTTLTRLGFGDKCPSLNGICNEMKTRGFMRIFAFFCAKPIISANPNCVPDIGSVMDKENLTSSSAYFTEAYKTDLQTVLPIFEKDGIFD